VYTFGVLAMGDVGIFFGTLVYFMAIYIFLVIWHLFGISVHFSSFWYIVPRKNLATLLPKRHFL
jgi:hypothetical protein